MIDICLLAREGKARGSVGDGERAFSSPLGRPRLVFPVGRRPFFWPFG